MKRDHHQRIAYGLGRMSRAADRVICARSDQDRARAKKWVLAWARVAKVVQHGG